MTESIIISSEHSIGMDDLESEHSIQYQLLLEIEQLVAANKMQTAQEIALQLYNYSEAHFGSEQVLMRLHSYPGYQAHEREHGELLTALRRLLADFEDPHAARAAVAVRQWLTSHIHHADRAFFDFTQSAEE
jgi:hemerythrin-like metal-binding protein